MLLVHSWYFPGRWLRNANPIFVQINATFYGVDWNGPIPSEVETESVQVPLVECPYDYFEQLRLINPFSHSESYGIDLYLSTLEFLQNVP